MDYCVEIGNGACDLEYAVVGSCRQSVELHSHAQLLLGLSVRLAVLANHLRCHLCVAVDTGAAETFGLNSACFHYTLTDSG